jgi:hypothetical protein
VTGHQELAEQLIRQYHQDQASWTAGSIRTALFSRSGECVPDHSLLEAQVHATLAVAEELRALRGDDE